MQFDAGGLLLQILIRQIRIEAQLRQVASAQSELTERMTGRAAADVYSAMREDAEAEAHAVAVGVFKELGIPDDVIQTLLENDSGGTWGEGGHGLDGES
jgi:hypothetical protein